MVEINPETQKSRRERLATVTAIGLSALFHLFVFLGGIQLYRWVEEEEKKEQLMVIQRVHETFSEALQPDPQAPQRRPAQADSEVKEEGAQPPPKADDRPDDYLPEDPPPPVVPETVEEEREEEVTKTAILVRTDLREATFTISGPVEFHGSGTSLIRRDVPPGEYTATFHSVPGYTAPPQSTKALAQRSEIIFTGRYSKSILIKVTLSGIPSAGFDILQPDGRRLPMDRPGSALFDNLPRGSYTIVFHDVPGYLTPAPQTQTLGVGGDSLGFAGGYLPEETTRMAPARKADPLDRRVQMVVKSYPPTSIEKDFDYIRYPELTFTRRTFQQGWCRVYLVVTTDELGRVAGIHVERPGPDDREQFGELIDTVRAAVRRWQFDPARAEVHVDVRFYVE